MPSKMPKYQQMEIDFNHQKTKPQLSCSIEDYYKEAIAHLQSDITKQFLYSFESRFALILEDLQKKEIDLIRREERIIDLESKIVQYESTMQSRYETNIKEQPLQKTQYKGYVYNISNYKSNISTKKISSEERTMLEKTTDILSGNYVKEEDGRVAHSWKEREVELQKLVDKYSGIGIGNDAKESLGELRDVVNSNKYLSRHYKGIKKNVDSIISKIGSEVKHYEDKTSIPEEKTHDLSKANPKKESTLEKKIEAPRAEPIMKKMNSTDFIKSYSTIINSSDEAMKQMNILRQSMKDYAYKGTVNANDKINNGINSEKLADLEILYEHNLKYLNELCELSGENWAKDRVRCMELEHSRQKSYWVGFYDRHGIVFSNKSNPDSKDEDGNENVNSQDKDSSAAESKIEQSPKQEKEGKAKKLIQKIFKKNKSKR